MNAKPFLVIAVAFPCWADSGSAADFNVNKRPGYPDIKDIKQVTDGRIGLYPT